MQGHSLEIRWTESGTVKVLKGGSSLVSASIGRRKGPTSATCLPTGVKFLTDTQEVPGKFTLETVKMDLSSVLSTLRPPDPPPAPKPRKVRRPRPKPPVPQKPPATPGEKHAQECVETKAWEAYEQDWTARSISTEQLEPGAKRNLALQMIAGQEYRLLVCAEESVPVLEALLVDADGFQKAENGGDRQLELVYTALTNGTFHLVVENPGLAKGAVGIAVLTR